MPCYECWVSCGCGSLGDVHVTDGIGVRGCGVTAMWIRLNENQTSAERLLSPANKPTLHRLNLLVI